MRQQSVPQPPIGSLSPIENTLNEELEHVVAAAEASEPSGGGPDDSATAFHLAAAQCLLFAAGRAVLPEEVARALHVDRECAEDLLAILQQRFDPGGLQVVAVAGGYQMTTRAEYASLLSRFLEPPPQRLSQPALETAALIAYRQPLTLPEIEAVRGVKSDSSVRTLLERGLIEDAGRKEVVGRPILYRTTPAFLTYLGIDSLAELPPLDSEMEREPPADAHSEDSGEDPVAMERALGAQNL